MKSAIYYARELYIGKIDDNSGWNKQQHYIICIVANKNCASHGLLYGKLCEGWENYQMLNLKLPRKHGWQTNHL